MFSPYPKEAKQLLNGFWLVSPSKSRRKKHKYEKTEKDYRVVYIISGKPISQQIDTNLLSLIKRLG